MAPADVEWVFGVVRAGRDYQGMENAKAGGAGYEFTATIIVRGRTAEIVGGAGRLTPALAKEIEIALHSHGITTAIWERYNGDPKRLVRATRGRSSREDGNEPPEVDQQVPQTRAPEPEMPFLAAGAQPLRQHNATVHSLVGAAYVSSAAGLNGLQLQLGDCGCQRLGSTRTPEREATFHQKVGNG